MKQQLVVEDLEELTESQRQTLNELWTPKAFERAVAYICRDVEEEDYEAYEFVIGGISIRGTGIRLTDLKAFFSDADEEPVSYETEESEEEPEEEKPVGFLERLFGPSEEEEDDDPEEGELLPEGWDSMKFDAFSKEDCLPLFTLGQLVEALQKLKYGDGSFHLGIGADQMGWVDRDSPTAYVGGAEYSEEELCDALWAAVRDLLK